MTWPSGKNLFTNRLWEESVFASLAESRPGQEGLGERPGQEGLGQEPGPASGTAGDVRGILRFCRRLFAGTRRGGRAGTGAGGDARSAAVTAIEILTRLGWSAGRAETFPEAAGSPKASEDFEHAKACRPAEAGKAAGPPGSQAAAADETFQAAAADKAFQAGAVDETFRAGAAGKAFQAVASGEACRTAVAGVACQAAVADEADEAFQAESKFGDAVSLLERGEAVRLFMRGGPSLDCSGLPGENPVEDLPLLMTVRPGEPLDSGRAGLSNPFTRLVLSLDRLEVGYGILTNGSDWLLTDRSGRSASRGFAAFRLGEIAAQAGSDPAAAKAFPMFLNLFGACGFARRKGERPLLRHLAARDAEKRLELEHALWALVCGSQGEGELLAKAGSSVRGFLARAGRSEPPGSAFDAARRLVFRLLFAKWLEDACGSVLCRVKGYPEISLSGLVRKIAARPGAWRGEGFGLWAALRRLFGALGHGEGAERPPLLGKGFFSPESALLLEEPGLFPDGELRGIVSALAIDGSGEVRDFSLLSPVRLGSLYQGVWERKDWEGAGCAWIVASSAVPSEDKPCGRVPDPARKPGGHFAAPWGAAWGRKRGGAYYTPPALARPLARRAAERQLETAFRALEGGTCLEGGSRGTRSLMEMRILDCACGSGQLLAEILDVLTEKAQERLENDLPLRAALDRELRLIKDGLRKVMGAGPTDAFHGAEAAGGGPEGNAAGGRGAGNVKSYWAVGDAKGHCAAGDGAGGRAAERAADCGGGLLERLADERTALRRALLRSAVHGVDLSGFAAELARLCLGLSCFVPGAPPPLLEDRVKRGNSLIGSVFQDVEAHPAAAPFAPRLAASLASLRELACKAAIASEAYQEGDREAARLLSFSSQVKEEADRVLDLVTFWDLEAARKKSLGRGGAWDAADGLAGRKTVGKEAPLAQVESSRRERAAVNELASGRNGVSEKEAASGRKGATEKGAASGRKGATEKGAASRREGGAEKETPSGREGEAEKETPSRRKGETVKKAASGMEGMAGLDVRAAEDSWEMLWRILGAEISALRAEHGFFNWETEFPEACGAEGEGFHVIVTNPPWDRTRFEDPLFFSWYVPEYRELPESAKRGVRERLLQEDSVKGLYARERGRAQTMSAYYMARYPLSRGAGDGNLYRHFVERALALLAPAGSLACIVPSALMTDDGSRALRKRVFSEFRISRFDGFENRRKVFADIHSCYKFCLIQIEKTPDPLQKAGARFMLTDPEALRTGRGAFSYSLEDVRALSPEHLAYLEMPGGEEDRELCRRLSAAFPPLDAAWLDFRRELDATLDKGIFLEEKRLGLVPLYKGGMFRQFDARYAEARQWVDPRELERRLAVRAVARMFSDLEQDEAAWRAMCAGEGAGKGMLQGAGAARDAVAGKGMNVFGRALAKACKGPLSGKGKGQSQGIGTDKGQGTVAGKGLGTGVGKGLNKGHGTCKVKGKGKGVGKWGGTGAASGEEKKLRKGGFPATGGWGGAFPEVLLSRPETLTVPDSRYPRLCFRAIARDTDERSMIAAIIPAGVGIQNSAWASLPGRYWLDRDSGRVRFREVSLERLFFALGIMNSLPFDWMLRRSVAMNVNKTFVKRMPFPQPPDREITPGSLCWDLARDAARLTLSNTPDLFPEARELFCLEEDCGLTMGAERDELQAGCDVTAARIYGLRAKDLKTMLKGFAVLARNRPRYAAEIIRQAEERLPPDSGKWQPL